VTDQPQNFEELYRQLRPHAFAVAYRMLGSVSEAEDAVQDAFVRLQSVALAELDSPKAYVTTVVTRSALNRLRAARTRRESYVGPWLPEPLLGVIDPPAVGGESLSLAFLVLLERLSPVERAVFVLREVFEYDYDEIAAVVEKSSDNCRQILARARRHVDAARPRFEASEERRQALAERFFAAASGGDVAGLVAMLSADATFYGDGGGKATAFPRPIEGQQRVAQVMAGLWPKFVAHGVRMEPVLVNGQPGALFRDPQGGLINVMALDIDADGRVAAVRSIINPDKLGHLGPLSALPRR
jgi:RNA polymerase sigma-70 factor (ECF subfamily)